MSSANHLYFYPGQTGTLTTANMSIINDSIYAADGFTEEDVIKFGYLCSNADKKDDPIGKFSLRVLSFAICYSAH